MAYEEPKLRAGNYVVATKYNDGDPGDHFCVGFYSGAFDNGCEVRYLIVDNDGQQFRANGFRRVECIGFDRGRWLVTHFKYIEDLKDEYSVWHWVHATWAELNAAQP